MSCRHTDVLVSLGTRFPGGAYTESLHLEGRYLEAQCYLEGRYLEGGYPEVRYPKDRYLGAPGCHPAQYLRNPASGSSSSFMCVQKVSGVKGSEGMLRRVSDEKVEDE